jgi:HK97 family phage prohead protease/HK97 family phage major capsid protein
MNTVRKTAATVAGGGEFVLSDETRDRYGDIVEAAGWELRAFKRNPIALFGHDSSFPIGIWRNVRVEGKRLLGRLEFAAAGTSARIDELRSLVEQGVLKAVSVGFRVLAEPVPIEPRGLRFTKHELLETSLVAVPANPAALSAAKALGISDDTLRLAFGEHAVSRSIAGNADTGGHAETLPGRKTKMTKLADRVAAAATELNEARDALAEYVKEDAVDDVVIDELSATVELRERALSSLKKAEKALAASTMPVGDRGPEITAPAIRRPLGQVQREPKPADLFMRAALCHVVGQVTSKDPLKVLDERYGDHEATQVVVRAAIAGAATTVAGWAAELVEQATVDWLETLRAASIFPQLAALGQSLTFGPGRGSLKIPSRASTPSISGSFVAEGAPIPVRRIGLTSIPLLPHKLAVISVFTREMARYSNPQIEGILRREIVADTALTIDTLLQDATAGSATRPAGLRFGLSTLTPSAAGGYAAILADVNTILAPFDAANASTRIALLMNPAQARLLAMTPGPDGTFGWATQFLSNISVISSTTVTAGDLIAVGVDDFVAVVGAPEFDASEQTVLHMEDTTPLPIGGAAVANPSQSMFQTASVALRMLNETTWAMRRAGMVQWIDNVDWAP